MCKQQSQAAEKTWMWVVRIFLDVRWIPRAAEVARSYELREEETARSSAAYEVEAKQTRDHHAGADGSALQELFYRISSALDVIMLLRFRGILERVVCMHVLLSTAKGCAGFDQKASVLSGVLPCRICAEPWILSSGCGDEDADMHTHSHPHVRAEFPREQLSAARTARRGRSSCCTSPGKDCADSAWYTHVNI